jgi:histidinol-phosphatase (PHP family)
MMDYHLHTKLCKHARGEVYEYVEEAIRQGILEIAFTDHAPLPDSFDIAHRMQENELDIYANWVYQVKERFPEIKIRFGLEADYYEGFENYTEKMIQSYEFDLIIMSVHFLSHWSHGNWVFDYYFPGKEQKDIYSDYINSVIKGIQTGLFDTLGHVDLVKFPGDSLIKMIPEEVNRLLSAVKMADMAIEINTSGYRKNTGESYPGFDWLRAIINADIPLTIGSDAHAPDQVGFKFNDVYRRLKDEKNLVLAFYKNRKRQNKPIGDFL